jgi:putative acetyltransferase
MNDKVQVRKAKPEDAAYIHEAHMRSIHEVCSKDYSPEEVAAWGGRSFDPDRWLQSILNHHVWVIEVNKGIEGFGHIRIFKENECKLAHIHGLYLTPKATGRGAATQVLNLMLNIAKESHVTRITLESSITAHEFYKKYGFIDRSPQTTMDINGALIRCYPMVKEDIS